MSERKIRKVFWGEREVLLSCLLGVLGDPPIVVSMLTPTQKLHKLLVMRNNYQLEVPLLLAARDDAREGESVSENARLTLRTVSPT